MTDDRITVLLADDQDLMREALDVLLQQQTSIRVVGHARNGLEAVETAIRLRPDVVLMDVRMPGLDGVDATSRIKSTRGMTRTRVLVLTTFDDADVVRACMKAGADGFIGKGVSTAALVDAIHAVARGDSPISPRAARFLLAELSSPMHAHKRESGGLSELTSREVDIVRLVGLGLSNEEIGWRLSISPATAKTHVRNAMKKLAVHDRAQLVALAGRVGLTP